MEMRDLKHSLTVDMDVSEQVSGEIHEGIEVLVFLCCSLLYGIWNVPCDDSRSMSHSFDSTGLRDGTLMIEYTRHY
jgi:hypothetical protein